MHHAIAGTITGNLTWSIGKNGKYLLGLDVLTGLHQDSIGTLINLVLTEILPLLQFRENLSWRIQDFQIQFPIWDLEIILCHTLGGGTFGAKGAPVN